MNIIILYIAKYKQYTQKYTCVSNIYTFMHKHTYIYVVYVGMSMDILPKAYL